MCRKTLENWPEHRLKLDGSSLVSFFIFSSIQWWETASQRVWDYVNNVKWLHFLVNGIRGWQLRIFYRFHGCDGKLFPYSSNCAAIATTESLTIGTKLLVSNICRQLVGEHQKSSKNMNETTIWIDSKAPNFHFVTWSSQVKRGCTAKRSFQALRKWSRGVFCHEILVIFYGIYYRTSNVHIMRFFHGIPISVINTL